MPLPAAVAWRYADVMTKAENIAEDTYEAESPAPSRTGIALLAGGALTLVLAGLLLWWREGDRLFTDGLIAAIVACF
ncbi:MAG: hypothetical protein DCF30_02820 [Hyphomicrobiales bacterium]|nr:MAG: hypothetical protein DCF30_02820 [Hyphomicrobiales bacterium]